ncbi:MAG: leucine-rich repeat domain-containing protein, partial [Oscillospiraceae bacterium]
MKKKLKIKGLSILMAILMVASIIPMGAISSFAADADYQYSVVSETDKTIKIEKYVGAGGDITIPSTIDGYTVISLGFAAFENCISLTSVIIGSSVTMINSQAFYGCTGLKAINISEGNTVFSSVDGVLYSKDKTSLLICPNGKSGEFIIPNTVTSIGDAAFQGCAGLTSLIIGSAVTSIGQMAFYYCTGLKSITIPDSVTSIYNNPFAGCTALTAINVTEGNKAFSSVDGVLYSKDKKQLLICSGKSDEFIVPTGVTNIGIGAFSNCYGLTNVTISDSVTNIGH